MQINRLPTKVFDKLEEFKKMSKVKEGILDSFAILIEHINYLPKDSNVFLSEEGYLGLEWRELDSKDDGKLYFIENTILCKEFSYQYSLLKTDTQNTTFHFDGDEGEIYHSELKNLIDKIDKY